MFTINTASALHAHDSGELTVIDNNDVGFSIRASLMSVEGQSDEYVYNGHNSSAVPSNYKVSELNWDISSLWMLGGEGSLQLGKYIRFNAGMWFGITDGDGMMKDYDWMRPNIPDWTHYSESDVDIETAYSLDMNASLQVIELGTCKLHAMLGYKLDYWEWSDYGGRYIHSSDSGFRDRTGSFNNINGIDYNQTFEIFYAGLKATIDSEKLHASAYVKYSPFVYAEDEDHHILRDLYFTEEFENGDFYAAGAEATLDFTETLFATLAVDWQDIPEFTGDLKVRAGQNGSVQTNNDGAGIGNTVTAISAALGIKF
jgi:outer membrane protease